MFDIVATVLLLACLQVSEAEARRSFRRLAVQRNWNPSFEAGDNVAVMEDSGDYSFVWATNVSDGQLSGGKQSLSFNVSAADTSLFETQPAIDTSKGLLTFRPKKDAVGSTTVTVYLQDDGITYCPTTTTALPTTTTTTTTTTVPGTTTDTTTTTDPTTTEVPTTTPVPTACVCTPGDCSKSASESFTITIKPVNDCPDFTDKGDQTVAEDSGVTSISNWATSVSIGPSNENGQKLTWTINNDNNPLFEVQPTIDYTDGKSNASLRFKPAANKYGTATVTVTLADDGGVANGGCDQSGSSTFSITVTPVNDNPSFTAGQGSIQVDEDSGPYTQTNWATQLNIGAPYEDGQTLSFTLEVGNSSQCSSKFKTLPAINTAGTLTFEPAENKNTYGLTCFVFVQLADSSGGKSCSPITNCSKFEIIINRVNDAPSFTRGADVEVWEDLQNMDTPPTPAKYTGTAWATDVSVGNDEEVGEGQTVSFVVVVESGSSLFSVVPAIDSNGTLTFTLAKDKNGGAIIRATIRDSATSNNEGTSQTFAINVLPVNDAPLFNVSATTVTVDEDSSVKTVTDFVASAVPGPSSATDETGQQLHVSVSAEDSNKFSQQPSVAMTTGSSGTLTFQVAENAFGEVNVTLSLIDNGGVVRKGVDRSSQTIKVIISSINDPPSFEFSTSTVTIIEDEYPNGYVLDFFLKNLNAGPGETSQSVSLAVSSTNTELFSVQPKIDSSSGKLTFTAAADAFGESVVTVTATDNANSPLSNSKTFQIKVLAKNDAPTFTIGDSLSLQECRTVLPCAYSFSGWLSSMTVGSSKETSQALLSVQVSVDQNSAILFSSSPTVSLSSGLLSFSLRPYQNTAQLGIVVMSVTLCDDGGTANDGVDSTTKTALLQVTAFTLPPSFLLAESQIVVLEDCGAQSLSSFIYSISGGTSNSSDTIQITLSVANPDLFQKSPAAVGETAKTAMITFTPQESVFGSSVVTVRVDNLATGKNSSKEFTIVVTEVNDRPAFELTGDVVVLQGSGSYVGKLAHSINVGPNESTQSVSFSISCASTQTLFSVAPWVNASGALFFTVSSAASVGTALCGVTMKDSGGVENGGEDTSAAHSFSIRVGPVNHAPSFRIGPDITVLEDIGYKSYNTWATQISVGEGDSLMSQTLTFSVECSASSSLFKIQPTINSFSGTLSFETEQDANGIATCAVVLHDSGPGNLPDVNTSSSQSFRIQVVAVNDPPMFISGSSLTLYEDEESYSAAWATNISPGPANEASQTFVFTVTSQSGSSDLFLALPEVSVSGFLSFMLKRDANGIASLSVCLKDNGGTVNSGVDSSCATLTISVLAVNDPPSFQLSNFTVTQLEDAGDVRVVGLLQRIAPGPPDEVLTQSVISARADLAAGCPNALFAFVPTIDAASGDLTFTTAQDQNGSCNVTVTILDSLGLSYKQAFTIVILPVNDEPRGRVSTTSISAIEGDALFTVPEWVWDVSPGPQNEALQKVTASVTVDSVTAFSVLPRVTLPGGNLTFALGKNVVGSIVITLVLTDDGGTNLGGKNSATISTATILITRINDAPSFSISQEFRSIVVLEDSAVSTYKTFVTDISPGSDEDSQQLSFVLTADRPELFVRVPSINATSGELKFEVAPNRFGTAVLSIVLVDNGGTANGGLDKSAPETFNITVVNVNDAPSFSLGSTPVYALEDQQFVAPSWIVDATAGPFEDDIQFCAFYLAAPKLGMMLPWFAQISVSLQNLTIDPAADFFGTLDVVVYMKDSGLRENGGIDEYQVSSQVVVLPVNDAPNFTLWGNIELLQNSTATTIQNFIRDVSPGPFNEEEQTVSVSVTASNLEIFSEVPYVAEGALQFKLSGQSGVSVLTVSVRDSGGTANGGVDSSTQTASFTVLRINKAPSFRSLFSSLRASVGASIEVQWASSITDPDGATADVKFVVQRVVSSMNDFVPPNISSSGSLMLMTTSTPGTAILTIVAQDSEGGTSLSATLTIVVVVPQHVQLTLQMEVAHFNVTAFQVAVGAIFGVPPQNVIVVSVRGASVIVEFYISGVQPEMTPIAFVSHAKDSTNPIHDFLPVEDAQLVELETTAMTTEFPDSPEPSIISSPSEKKYIVIALVVVASLLLICVAVAAVRCIRRRQVPKVDSSVSCGVGMKSLPEDRPPVFLPIASQTQNPFRKFPEWFSSQQGMRRNEYLYPIHSTAEQVDEIEEIDEWV